MAGCATTPLVLLLSRLPVGLAKQTVTVMEKQKETKKVIETTDEDWQSVSTQCISVQMLANSQES